MEKNINDIVFDDRLLEKYKDDNDKITSLCKKADKNKIIQLLYKKFLKNKQKELKINYNNFEELEKNTISIEEQRKKLTINGNEKYVVSSKKCSREFYGGQYC